MVMLKYVQVRIMYAASAENGHTINVSDLDFKGHPLR